MNATTALFLVTTVVVVPVAIAVWLLRRHGARMSAFAWIVLACSWLGLVLTAQGLEDALEGHVPWTKALAATATLVLMPAAVVVLSALVSLPFLALEALLDRWHSRRQR